VTALRKNKQTTHEIALQGQAALLDLTGAMYLPEHDALLVADLHFEKGSSFARRGMMLPPYDTRETLMALSDAVFRFDPKTVIALGDSFHDIGGPDRLGDDERKTLSEVQAGREWIWVTGNHDRILPDSIGGQVVEEMALGSLTLRHEPLAGDQAEIAGHLHPVGKVVMRGRATAGAA
jgi:DNA ligase-associated metallophosphoesterase